MAITKRELEIAQKQLECERQLSQLYNNYARQVKNPSLRAKCEQLAGAHENHYQLLCQVLSKEVQNGSEG